MTEQEMKDEIIQRVLTVPAKNWFAYSSIVNGIKVSIGIEQIKSGACHFRKFYIEIGGIKIYSNSLSKLCTEVIEFNDKRLKESEARKLKEIHHNIVRINKGT